MPETRYRVLVIASHPVQYMSPLLRWMAKHPQLDLHVAYCSLKGAQAVHDPDFNTTVQWDIPLLEGYSWEEIRNRGSGAETFFGLFNPGLFNVIRKGKYDAIVSLTGYICASFWLSFAAARWSGAAFLFGTDASSLESRDSRRWKVTVKKLIWRHLFGLADQVIAPSSAGMEMLRSLGIPNNRITLTPFVVDNDWWSLQASKVNRAAVRESWGVTADKLVVLFCAKLQGWKRPLDLLRAFAAADVSDAVLVYAGDGPLLAALKAEAHSLGVESRVRFLGFTNQSQLPSVYSSADLFVLTSDDDPCPVVVCESMLCGLPVLLSDKIRGRFDLVIPGQTGDIFPCGNVDALRVALRKLLADRVGLAVLSRNARTRMESWSPKENVAGMVDAIHRAVASAHKEMLDVSSDATRT